MAKKKRKDDAEWDLPEFDEVQYMRTEIRSARAAIVAVLWAVPAALVSWGITLANLAVVAFFAGLGMMFLLKWLVPLVGVETKEWKRRDWLGHGTTFFFSWLAFWILLLNPPFADLTNPHIVSVSVGTGTVGCGGTLYSVPTGTYNLTVSAGDNVGVAGVSANFGGTSSVNLIPKGGILWQTSWAVSGIASVTITARDVNGHVSPACTVTVTPGPAP